MSVAFFFILIMIIITGIFFWASRKVRKDALEGDIKRELKALGYSKIEPEANQVDVEADGEVLLIKAILEQKEEVVDWLLKKGVSPNTRDSDGVPALSLAAKCNSINMVKKLIRAGADVNAMDKQGNTALFCVISAKVCQELIKAGAVVSACNQDNQTPLFFSVIYFENDKLSAECVKQGLDPNHRDNFGKNALFYANIAYSAYSIEKLIQMGVDPNCIDSDGKTPIFYVQNKKLALSLIRNGAKLILTDHHEKGIPILEQLRKTLNSYEYNTLPNVREWLDLNRDLAKAITNQKVNDVKKLLKLGADPNSCEESENKNMMTLAIQNDAPEIIQLLVDAGASIHQTNLGISPLMRSAQDGMLECFELLMNLGANPDNDKSFSFELILNSVKTWKIKQYLEIIKKILNCGVKRTKEVWKTAIENGNTEVIDTLLNCCPEISGACLEMAVQNNNRHVWMWQVENGFKINSSIVSIAVRNHNYAFLRYAVEKGFVIDGFIVSIMIEYDNIECLKYAVENGAVIDISCLDKALSHNATLCALFILEQGVIPDASHVRMAVRNNMTSVLQRILPVVKGQNDVLLEDLCLEGKYNILKMLVESGWKLSHACLVNAVKNGHVECIQYIIEQGVKPDRSMLDLALNLNNPQSAQLIMKYGVEPTEADLCLALNNGSSKFVKLIINHGVIPEHKHLDIALENKNTKCVNILLKNGVEPYGADLYTCINNEDIQSAREILKSDKLYSYDITDALEYAEKYSECKGIKRLLRRYDESGEI